MNKKSDFFDKLIDAFRELEFIKEYIPPINKAGYPFIILFFNFSFIISFSQISRMVWFDFNDMVCIFFS